MGFSLINGLGKVTRGMKDALKYMRRSEKGFTLIEVLVVVAILGILIALVILNVLGMMNRGEVEAKLTEQHNLQTGVYAMMVKAKVQTLDEACASVDELAEIQGVTAGGGAYSLDEFLMGGGYPLKQAYDISSEGTVSIAD